MILILMAMARSVAAEPVVVFAAASLKGPLDMLFSGQDVVVSYGGSGAMAQQIAQGAPADIYISANPVWVDWLEMQGRILPETRVAFLGNALAVISHAPFEGDVAEALAQGPVAMGHVTSVPAGGFARQALEAMGLWPDVEPVAVQVGSVSAATRLVQLGEVPFGIVYATESLAADVQTVGVIDAGLHDPIIYPAVMVEDAKPEAAAVFAQLAEARDVFSDHGFIWLLP